MSAKSVVCLLPLAVLALTIVSAAAAPADTPAAERPVYALGDTWVRSDGAFQLVRVEGGEYVFAKGPRHEVRLTRDLGISRLQRGESVLAFAPAIDLAWPLRVGGVGVINGRWSTPKSGGWVPVRTTWSVDAYEDVDLPAGTLKAFRIGYAVERTGRRGGGIAQSDFTIWYAPEVQRIVKASSADLPMLDYVVVGLDRPAPLTVTLSTPVDGVRVAGDTTALRGTVASGKGVRRVRVTLNDAEIHLADEPGAPRELRLDFALALRPGRNTLLVTATDASGETRQEARTLLREPVPSPPAVAAVPSPAPLPPRAVPGPQPAAPAPLTVQLAAPGDQLRVEQERIALAGVVTSGKGVRRVEVTLNGAEVTRREEVAPRPSVTLNESLTLREGRNTLVVTVTEADGTAAQEVRTVHYEKRLPLTVELQYPTEGTTLSEPSTVVVGLAAASRGLAKVSVTLNGAEVLPASEGVRAGQTSLGVTLPVVLRPGANVVVLAATDAEGAVRQVVRSVTYRPPSVAAAPPAPLPKPTHERWAVIVGVGRYEHRDIPALQYAVKDAEALYRVLTGSAGFKKDHVLLLTDTTEKKPTLRNVKWALGTFLARSAKREDSVLIYFAGHGAPEVDQRGLERDGLAKYLITADADPDDLFSTALPMDDIQTIFGRIEAERVVTFIDACYSGAAGGRTFASKRTRATSLDDLFLERLTRAKGRAIVTASRPSEVSLELSDLGHGIFTYFLVRGLEGAGDLNRDGIVSLQELYEYLAREVSGKARSVGGKQNPVLKGELEGLFPLVTTRGR